MKKIGYIVDNLLVNQLNFELFSNKTGFLFTKELTKSFVKIDMALMDITEIWGFDDGVLIATSVETGLFMEQSVNNSRKILYLYDYEEVLESKEQEKTCQMLTNKNIEIAVRSEFFATRFKKQFNRPVKHIWKDINECIRREEQDLP